MTLSDAAKISKLKILWNLRPRLNSDALTWTMGRRGSG